MFAGRGPGGYARRRLVVLLVAAVSVTALAFGIDRVVGGGGGERPGPDRTTDAVGPSSSNGPTSSDGIDPLSVAPSDRFVVAAGGTPVVGAGRSHTYTVEVEAGIPLDAAQLAGDVDAIVADGQGWTAGGDVSLQRVGPDGDPDFRVRLATPATTDAHCAPLDTGGEQSCRNGADVMINLVRWLEGAAPSGLPLAQYRQYVISHEIGHALGHEHVDCPARGQLAPVMLQQTLGLDGCAPNPWPYP